MICDNCMQLISSNNECFCTNKIRGVRYIESVSGCIYLHSNGKRCKNKRVSKDNNELYSCAKHITPIPEQYTKMLESFKD